MFTWSVPCLSLVAWHTATLASIPLDWLQMNCETLLLRRNNKRCSHWVQPRPLDAQGEDGDGNPGCGPFSPIQPKAVAFGMAKFASGDRGELAMPKSQAFNECVQPFRTVLVDEFRRTMVRAGDGLAMTQLWSRRKQAAVRGLMWRNSTIR